MFSHLTVLFILVPSKDILSCNPSRYIPPTCNILHMHGQNLHVLCASFRLLHLEFVGVFKFWWQVVWGRMVARGVLVVNVMFGHILRRSSMHIRQDALPAEGAVYIGASTNFHSHLTCKYPLCHGQREEEPWSDLGMQDKLDCFAKPALFQWLSCRDYWADCEHGGPQYALGPYGRTWVVLWLTGTPVTWL